MVYTIAANSALMVTISYWSFLFTFENTGEKINIFSSIHHV